MVFLGALRRGGKEAEDRAPGADVHGDEGFVVGGVFAFGGDLLDQMARDGDHAFGVADDDILGTSVELSNTYGLFLVVSMPVSERVDIFVRGGFASGEVDVGGTSVSDDGGAYGVGVQAFWSENDGVRFDYSRYNFGGDADVWAVSYVRKF